MTNLIKVGAIAALATVGVIFGNVTASALETTRPAAPKITVSTAQYKGEKNTIKFEGTANGHYRFVITSGANKIQLRSPIRQELMQGSELSIEDLVKRTKLNRTVVDLMKEYECLKDLSATNQQTLF